MEKVDFTKMYEIAKDRIESEKMFLEFLKNMDDMQTRCALAEEQLKQTIRELQNQIKQSSAEIVERENRIKEYVEKVDREKTERIKSDNTVLELRKELRELTRDFEDLKAKSIKIASKTGRPAYKFTDEDIANMLMLREHGKSLQDIANEYKVSKATIHRTISKDQEKEPGQKRRTRAEKTAPEATQPKFDKAKRFSTSEPLEPSTTNNFGASAGDEKPLDLQYFLRAVTYLSKNGYLKEGASVIGTATAFNDKYEKTKKNPFDEYPNIDWSGFKG